MESFHLNFQVTHSLYKFTCLSINIYYPNFQTLCEHLEETNIEGFTDAIKDYDSISRLDQWYTTILLGIKKQYNEDPDLR